MLTMQKEALPAAPTPRPGTGQRRQPWPGLEQEKPPPGVFSTGSGGGGQERQQAGDGFAEGRHSAPMGCKLPPPQSPGRGEARRAPACPRSHSSTRAAASGGSLPPLGQLLPALAEPRYNRQRLPSSALQPSPAPAGRGNTRAALLLL